MAKFFVGIRLPPEIEAECEAWRRKFKAPRTAAHITVIPPFTWKSSADALLRILKEGLGSIPGFEIRGRGLGSFGKRVIFVNVELDPELLRMQQHLAALLSGAGIPRENRPYRPHITLISRFRAAEFDRYQEQLRDFRPDYSFRCSAASLFRFTPAGRWEEAATIPLAP